MNPKEALISFVYGAFAIFLILLLDKYIASLIIKNIVPTLIYDIIIIAIAIIIGANLLGTLNEDKFIVITALITSIIINLIIYGLIFLLKIPITEYVIIPLYVVAVSTGTYIAKED